MQSSIVQYGIIMLTSLVLDGLWLGLIAKAFYKKQLGYLMAEVPNFKVGALFYIVFALGVMVFIVAPALSQGYSVGKVALLGALLGLVAYGAYDFTSHAIIKDWSAIVTVVDLAWGAVMTSVVSVISYLIIKAI